jgi:hypothetical protein
VPDRPFDALAQVLADPGEAGVRRIGRKLMRDDKAPTVQAGDQPVWTVRLLYWIAVSARDEDHVVRLDDRRHRERAPRDEVHP